MAVQKGDFVKLNYTGKLQDGTVFDTTDKKVAEENNLQGTKEMAPVTICVGESMLVKGLDRELEGKEGKFSVTVQPEEAFGKKDAKLLRIIPTPQLQKQGIRPYVGLELNIDGHYGVVRRSGGGRTTVDFNHPLSSQTVTYDVEILEKVEDKKAQIECILGMAGLPYETIKVESDKTDIKLKQMLPQPILDQLQNRIVELTKIKTVSFEAGEQKQ